MIMSDRSTSGNLNRRRLHSPLYVPLVGRYRRLLLIRVWVAGVRATAPAGTRPVRCHILLFLPPASHEPISIAHNRVRHVRNIVEARVGIVRVDHKSPVGHIWGLAASRASCEEAEDA